MTQIANLNTKLSLESASFLSGIEASRGALRSLVASLDPVAAATARYNRQVQLLEGAMQRQPEMANTYGLALQRLTQRYNEQIRNQGAVTTSAGSMRMGMQQLSFQVGDVAQQFATGVRPMVIFAQQIGQVQQAVMMMTGSSKGLLGFLAGPWGQIFTAAAVLVSALSSKLFENADAAKAAELANDGLSDAQSVLGKMFDLTSGKLEHQNELLRLNAQLTSLNLKTEADAARARASSTAGGARPSLMSFMAADIGAVGESRAAAGRISSAINQVLSGKLAADKAFSSISASDFAVTNVSREDFNKALTSAVEARFKGATAAEIDKTLKSGVLSDVFRQEGSGRTRRTRTPADRSDQRQEKADDQLARLKEEQARLQLAMTADLRYRANIQRDQVDAELEAYKTDVAHQVTQKEITAERGKELIAVKERNADIEKGRINRDLDNALAKEETDLAQSRLDVAQSVRAGELDAARTQTDRRRIQLQMLDAETAQLKFAIQQQLLSKDLTDVERERLQNRITQIDAEAANKRAGIQRGTMGPMEQFFDRLPQTADEMNEAFERVAAEGLQSLTDGLADAITGAKSLGAAFKDVTNQIINDLVRIAVQKYITGPLAHSLFGSGSGLAGLFGSGGGGVVTNTTAFAGADFSSFSLPQFAAGGALRIGGFPGVDRNTLAINGMPVARVSEGETLSISPRGSNDNGRGNNYYFSGNLMTPEFWAQIQAGDFAAANAGASGGVARMQYRQTRRVG